MKECNIAIVGAGPAGCMAAIKAVENTRSKKIVLIERNPSICKKLLLTGRKRCNITNAADIDAFISKFGKKGKFYRTAFHKFFNNDLIEFIEKKGVKLKTERQGRIFPCSDKAEDIKNVLLLYLKEKNVDLLLNHKVEKIEKKDNFFYLYFEGDKKSIKAEKLILATGGASYKETGSEGDGYLFAKAFGHKISSIKPALVPLETKERWPKALQGLTLKNIRITFYLSKRKIVSPVGELLFTHFGISGPLVLDLSGEIVEGLESGEIKAHIDLKPGLSREQLADKMINAVTQNGNLEAGTIMKDLIPKSMIDIFLKITNIPKSKKGNQVTKKERDSVIYNLKSLPLTISKSLPVDYGMVTNGGILLKEIDPRTMESKISKNLYFAGEIIEQAASSGGFNLQKAFSTGYLSGESVAK